MEKVPLVSIVCTAFNHEAFIKDALEGFILQRTDFLFEIIISDDASTDLTATIIKQYQDKYPKLFKPFYYENNQYSKGVPFFINDLMPSCKGKYIAFCEGDDYWTDPYKLQKQVDFLEANSEYVLVADNSIYYDVRTETKRLFSDLLERDITKIELLEKRHFSTAAVCFKNIVNKLDLSKNTGDIFIWCELIKHGKIKYLTNVSSVYRRHDNGITESNPLFWAQLMKNWNDLLYQNNKEVGIHVFNKRNYDNYKNATNYLLKKRNLFQFVRILICQLSFIDFDIIKNIFESYKKKSINILKTKIQVVNETFFKRESLY